VKFLRDFIDKQDKHFQKGGKLEKLYYLYEALDGFLYTPGKVTKTASHIRDAIDLKRMMMTVVYALVPTVIMALYNTGYQANLGLAQLGQSSIEGWRGTLITFLGLGFNPSNIVDNMIHGALYSAVFGKLSLLSSENMKFRKVSWLPAFFFH